LTKHDIINDKNKNQPNAISIAKQKLTERHKESGFERAAFFTPQFAFYDYLFYLLW
jgi:hypothetical protein